MKYCHKCSGGGGGLAVWVVFVIPILFLDMRSVIPGHEKCIDILDTSTLIYSQDNILLVEIFLILSQSG